jgi:hypothetical protein
MTRLVIGTFYLDVEGAVSQQAADFQQNLVAAADFFQELLTL